LIIRILPLGQNEKNIVTPSPRVGIYINTYNEMVD
ncbi:unnamed protein product, partial [marine sediment metagenome]